MNQWRIDLSLWAFIAMLFAVIAISFGAGRAAAEPHYCTPDKPYPGYQRICTGYGTSCNLNNTIACSPMPNVPGTWGPNGYTPQIG